MAARRAARSVLTIPPPNRPEERTAFWDSLAAAMAGPPPPDLGRPPRPDLSLPPPPDAGPRMSQPAPRKFETGAAEPPQQLPQRGLRGSAVHREHGALETLEGYLGYAGRALSMLPTGPALLQEVLRKQDPALAAYRARPVVPKAPPDASVATNIEEAKRHRGDAVWFYNQVKPNGPWDYKTQGLDYEDFGNFNYAATGAALGLSDDDLARAAGGVQKILPGKRYPGQPWGRPPYGDQPEDQFRIRDGLAYYRGR